jgi:hypothetical protein
MDQRGVNRRTLRPNIDDTRTAPLRDSSLDYAVKALNYNH